MIKCVLFDMDGTLVNSYAGIYNSYKYALKKMNLEFEGDKFVGKVIGAPLLTVFSEYFKLDAKSALAAVTYYREYYANKGKFQASVYGGIEKSLNLLKKNNYFIGIATLKREEFAKDIVKELNLQNYFNVISGIDENDKLKKSDIIKKCMDIFNVKSEETILVGDSEYDLEGAREAKIHFLGVSYGFGFTSIDTENVDGFVHSADKIGEYILKYDKEREYI